MGLLKHLNNDKTRSMLEKPKLRIDRPSILHGATYKVNLDHKPNAIYIIINNFETPKGLIPYELFINSLDPNYLAESSLISRLVSAFFREGGSASLIVKELKDIFEKETFWYKGKQYTSVAEIIGEVIEQHCKTIGYKL